MKIQTRIFKYQGDREHIRKYAPHLNVDTALRLDADEDVAGLHEYDHIVKPHAVGSLDNRQHIPQPTLCK
jgi:hypothetical protein